MTTIHKLMAIVVIGLGSSTLLAKPAAAAMFCDSGESSCSGGHAVCCFDAGGATDNCCVANSRGCKLGTWDGTDCIV
jgi:hypothetical protein